MESCTNVESEIDKVLRKFADVEGRCDSSLDDLINHIQGMKRELEDDGNSNDKIGASHTLLLHQCTKRVKEAVTKISSEHKDLHGNVSKVGKAIDKNFVSDFNSVFNEGAFGGEENQNEINQVICEHFLRQGMLSIAERLVEDSGLHLEDSQIEPFLELHRILESLKQCNLSPALHWTRAHRDQLEAHNSSLEFKLLRLQFIELVSQGISKQQEALIYARNFAPFACSHTKDVQVLMGSLLYIHLGLQNSPYSFLIDAHNWTEICDIFTRDACMLLGLSVESPLSIVIRAGCAALPPLLTIKQVMLQRQCSGVWTAKDELPVEIDVGHNCRFHSVFACPILKQQSNENNPPMRLICGHVISQDALSKLCTSNKVKCPYCPMEQSPGDARQIFF